jgi:protein-tyrosine phosphatase
MGVKRHIDFEGSDNFRDFGGYATASGAGLKRGLLYRSGHHARATDADLEGLGGLGITSIVDLRSQRERDREPSRRWPAFAARVVENDTDDGQGDWAEGLKVGAIDARRFRDDGVRFYAAAPFNPRYVSLFRDYFQALARIDGPMVVHCAAGKDRTGMVCALTHHVAGVHRDDLMADYLLTNDETRIVRRVAHFGPWLRQQTGQPVDDEVVLYALSADPAFLDASFAAIDETYGSVDRYLEQALGVDAGLRAQIEQRILA